MSNTKTKCSQAQARKAALECRGNKTKMGRELGVDRITVVRYLALWPKVQEAYEQGRETDLDECEQTLEAQIGLERRRLSIEQRKAAADPNYVPRYTDIQDTKWKLARLGKSRGFAERQEVTGADGDPVNRVEFVLVPDAKQEGKPT